MSGRGFIAVSELLSEARRCLVQGEALFCAGAVMGDSRPARVVLRLPVGDPSGVRGLPNWAAMPPSGYRQPRRVLKIRRVADTPAGS